MVFITGCSRGFEHSQVRKQCFFFFVAGYTVRPTTPMRALRPAKAVEDLLDHSTCDMGDADVERQMIRFFEKALIQNMASWLSFCPR